MPEIDRIVDEPARLAILTVLASCQSADFLFLEPATGPMRGNLSVQLTRLEEAGPVEIWKTIERRRTLTTAALTDRRHRTLDSYWESMEDLQAAAKSLAKVSGNVTKPDHHVPATKESTIYGNPALPTVSRKLLFVP
jgi:hypothetical protein